MEIIGKYLKYMMEKDASDIYFTVGVPPAFRIEGAVNPYKDAAPLTPDDTENIARSIMTERQKKKFKKPKLFTLLKINKDMATLICERCPKQQGI